MLCLFLGVCIGFLYWEICAYIPNTTEACFPANRSGEIPGDEGWEWKPSPGAYPLGRQWPLCCGHLLSCWWCWVSMSPGTEVYSCLAPLCCQASVNCVGLHRTWLEDPWSWAALLPVVLTAIPQPCRDMPAMYKSLGEARFGRGELDKVGFVLTYFGTFLF